MPGGRAPHDLRVFQSYKFMKPELVDIWGQYSVCSWMLTGAVHYLFVIQPKKTSLSNAAKKFALFLLYNLRFTVVKVCFLAFGVFFYNILSILIYSNFDLYRQLEKKARSSF